MRSSPCEVVEPQHVQAHTARAREETRARRCAGRSREQRAVQCHCLRGVFDRAWRQQAAARAQRVGRVALVAGGADDALGVPPLQPLEQAHRAAVRDQRAMPSRPSMRGTRHAALHARIDHDAQLQRRQQTRARRARRRRRARAPAATAAQRRPGRASRSASSDRSLQVLAGPARAPIGQLDLAASPTRAARATAPSTNATPKLSGNGRHACSGCGIRRVAGDQQHRRVRRIAPGSPLRAARRRNSRRTPPRLVDGARLAHRDVPVAGGGVVHRVREACRRDQPVGAGQAPRTAAWQFTPSPLDDVNTVASALRVDRGLRAPPRRPPPSRA